MHRESLPQTIETFETFNHPPCETIPLVEYRMT